MADVFISYARSDRRLVRRIAQGLAVEGFTVWWDPDILPGKKFDDVIRRELEQSLTVVTCWTRASAKSKWVLAETSFADGRKKLIPAMLQDCDPPIPYNMVNYADLAHWRGDPDDPEWLAFLAAVKAQVDAHRRPLVAAPPPPGDAEAAQGPAAQIQQTQVEQGQAAAPTPPRAAPEPEPPAPDPLPLRDPIRRDPPSAAQSTYDAERYEPSSNRRRAGGGRGGRIAAGVVLTAALTLGVLAAPELLGRIRDAITPAQPAPAPPPPPPIAAPEPAAIDVPSPTAEPAPELAPASVDTPTITAPTQAKPPTYTPPHPTPPPRKPAAAPAPVSTAPLAPAPDPRKPWTDLDSCTQTLAARCQWRAPRAGFAPDGIVTAQEGAFLRGLGVETRVIDAAVAQRCEALLPSATTLVDAAGKPTPLGTACGVQASGQSLSPAAKAAIGAGAALILNQVLGGHGQSEPARPAPNGNPQTPPSRTSPSVPVTPPARTPPQDPVVR